MRRYKEVKCDICEEYFDTTKHTSCPKESCKSVQDGWEDETSTQIQQTSRGFNR
jgi:phage FluMu protein Com|tara:strand:- start:328 stop:489 length:162 start_codon:yes stop_codon:yes gene_type:complete